MLLSKKLYLFLFLLSLSSILFSQNTEIQNKLRLAKSFESKGQLEEAEKIYTELHTLQPNNYQLYNPLNKILIKQKKYDLSLELIQNQIKLNNKNISLYGELGSTYFLIGEEEKAERVWESALKLKPNNAFSYRSVANYMLENRSIERAIEVLIRGNEVSTDDPTIFSYDIANLYSLTMKFEDATNEYCKLLMQKPKQLNTIKNKILGYINSNKAVESTLKTTEEYYEETENTIYLQLLVDLYIRTENITKAFDATAILEKETSRNGSVLFNFAQKLARLKNHKTAAQVYNKVISEYPNSALYSEAEIGYTRELEAELSKLKSINDDWKPLSIHPETNKSNYLNLIKAYKLIALKYPNNKVGWEAEYRMAKIYGDKLKDMVKADSIFNNIISEFKSAKFINESNFGLAKIAIQKNELNRAGELFEKIFNNRSAKQQLKTESKYYLAKVKMWQGQFSEAGRLLSEVSSNPKDINTNDALQLLLILNTFKNDSTNLFSFLNADYLVEKNNLLIASSEYKKITENDDLFILKDFAALRYVELLLALNNYQEAVIFLEQISICDEDNIYKDRFLYLLGASYYYGLKQNEKALAVLTKFFDKYPNSIYFSKARRIIAEINFRGRKNI